MLAVSIHLMIASFYRASQFFPILLLTIALFASTIVNLNGTFSLSLSSSIVILYHISIGWLSMCA